MDDTALRTALQKLNDATVNVEGAMQAAKNAIIGPILTAVSDAYAALGSAAPTPTSVGTVAVGTVLPPGGPGGLTLPTRQPNPWVYDPAGPMNPVVGGQVRFNPCFLDDKTEAEFPGNFIGYAQAYGYPDALLGGLMTMGVGNGYPPALTHAQLLAALVQGLPRDRDVGATWSAAGKCWMAAGVPYKSGAVPDPAWQAAFNNMQAKTGGAGSGGGVPASPPAHATTDVPIG